MPFFSKMRHLQALDFEGPFDVAMLRELSALRHLTSLKIGWLWSTEMIPELCSTLALIRLDLGMLNPRDFRENNFRRLFKTLAAGQTSGLQELVLPFPAAGTQQLSRLTALTALTALGVRMWDAPAELGGLAALTGLKSLRIETHAEDIVVKTPIVRSLAPLTALTELTSLDLYEHVRRLSDRRTSPPDLSVLSTLTALRVLRCSMLDEAEFQAGDPLLVQLRFLRTATALEELDLRFRASFWPLPDASTLAAHEAVRELSKLKKVTVRLGTDELEHSYYAPLNVFAAAPSTETLCYRAMGPEADTWDTITAARARACLKALKNLRSLTIERSGTSSTRAAAPRCADLLAGLPSTRLTCLNLGSDHSDGRLMRQCARFRDLQELVLVARPVRSDSLCHLFNLKCLTRLVLTIEAASGDDRRIQLAGWPPEKPPPRSWLCRGNSPEGVTISARAARLMTDILKRARLAGIAALVDMRTSHCYYDCSCTWRGA